MPIKKVIQTDLELPLIKYEEAGEIIYQRLEDGYVNATAMCKAVNKLFADYNRLKSTQEFVLELSKSMGIPIDLLIQSISKGRNEFRGTWVHPQVAIHLAQWLSPKFAVLVSKWVFDWLSGNIPKKEIPYHLRRYIANLGVIPYTHFSILQMLTIDLIAPLEQQGYTLPERMLPDISQGKMFCGWLRKEKGLDPKSFPTYIHRYEDGRQVQARLYPNTLLAEFREHFHTVWIPEKSIGYFEERDKKALPYLTEILKLIAFQKEIQYIDKN